MDCVLNMYSWASNRGYVCVTALRSDRMKSPATRCDLEKNDELSVFPANTILTT